MSRYTRSVLQPDERVTFEGRLHWVMYLPGVWWLIVGGAVVMLVRLFDRDGTIFGPYANLLALPFVLPGLYKIAKAAFIQWITEIVVTDRRVIQKTGFIARDTAEMNIQQVESVEVTQSVLGRILGYGTIRVHGSGHGLEALAFVASPLKLRTAITAR